MRPAGEESALYASVSGAEEGQNIRRAFIARLITIVKFNLEIWQTYDTCTVLPCARILDKENMVFGSITLRLRQMDSQDCF